ncbi:unnamed protein product, partial [Mesorhabditis spiculigera]
MNLASTSTTPYYEDSTSDTTPLPDDDYSAEVDPSEQLFDILCMATLGLLGTMLAIYGFVIVRRNTILKGIIEHYAFVDLLNMLLINGCHLCWGVPCAIWQLNEWSPLLDYIFSGIAFSAVSVGFPPKIFLTFNRFFALAFSGSYYKFYERTNYVQYGIMAAYPLATGIAYAIPGCGAIFIPHGQNFFYVEGACGEEVMYYTQILASYIVLSIQTVFDAAIFYLMRKRIRSFQAIQSHQNSKQKREQLKKEMRLAAQHRESRNKHKFAYRAGIDRQPKKKIFLKTTVTRSGMAPPLEARNRRPKREVIGWGTSRWCEGWIGKNEHGKEETYGGYYSMMFCVFLLMCVPAVCCAALLGAVGYYVGKGKR